MENVGRPHILILGGTGFLGRKIADEANRRGFRVSVFGRSAPKSDAHLRAEIQFDETSGECRVTRAPVDVDIVVNSLANYGRSGEGESELRQVNSEIPAAIAKHYVTGSILPKLFLNVDTALRSDLSLYAKTKAELRMVVAQLASRGLPVVGIRLDQFYGAGDADSKFVTMLVRKFQSGAESIPLSSGAQKRRFIFDSDAVMALFDVIERALQRRLAFSKGCEAVLPAIGVESSVRDLVLKVQQICKAERTRLDFGSFPDRGVETDTRALPDGYEFLEQRKFTSLEDGIRLLLESEKMR